MLLFQENTPSVVYITTLTVRYAYSRSVASILLGASVSSSPHAKAVVRGDI
jgi:hypothetical protein